MGTLKEKLFMVIKNERSKNKLSFLLAIISSAFFQIFVLIGLGILQFMFWFLLGGILYNIMGSSELVQTVPLIVSYIIIFIMYAVIWYFYWKHLYFDEIKWFKYRVFFSIIPLIIELVLFNPTNDPTAMINIPPEPMFSSLVKAIILLQIN